MSSIYVRDYISATIIEQLTGRTPIIHLDPILNGDFNEKIDTNVVKDNNYIIIYAKKIKNSREIHEIYITVEKKRN